MSARKATDMDVCPTRKKRRAPLQLEELEDRTVPTLLGQQLFPSDYPWNQNISNAPVAANSAAIIAHIGSAIKVHPDWGNDSASNGNSPLYGIPFNVAHGNTVTKINVIIDNYPGESDLLPVPIPANAVIEGDFQNGPNLNGGGYNTGQRGDSHLIVWDEDNNIAYELYGVTRPADPKLFPNTNGVELAHTDGRWHAAGEAVWNMSTNSFRTLGDTSADAAGLSILAGLARPDEGTPGGQGVINHALRFTLPSGDVSPQYIYPASHVVSVSAGSTKLPFGARLRLANTPAVNATINTLGPQAQILAHAMQQYGLVLADIGSAMFVTGTSAAEDANNNINFTWNMNDVLGLSQLTAGSFEVVDLSPQVTGLSANSGTAGNTITVVGKNFSGSAGHLAVFFNTTAASSVTYVDDSHLTVVVPNGTGTVDVTVRSGVITTDPNNPNNNAKNPVFGYGTSATSASDQFTYSGSVAVPVSPVGSITTQTPTFNWASVAGAVSYTIWLQDQNTGQITNFTNQAGTSMTLTNAQALTPGHGYSWSAGAVNAQGTTTWSANHTFSIVALATPTASGPTGIVGTLTPTFGWTTVSGAATYTIWLQDMTTGQMTLFPNLTGTSFTSTQSLTLGHSYSWFAGAVSSNGQATAWSAPLNFTVTPVATGPIGPLTTQTPTFSWTGVTGAASYWLWVSDQNNGQLLSVQNLSGSTYTPTTTQALTPGHSFIWWIGAVTSGATTWSAAKTFSIAALTAPITSGPTGIIGTTTPNFSWSAVSGAATYTLWVQDQRTSVVTTLPNLTTTAATLGAALTLGDSFTWYAGAVSANGQVTVWSAAKNFIIAPSATGPTGSISNQMPTFTWTGVTGAASYSLWITDQNSSQVMVNLQNLAGAAYTLTTAQALSPGHSFIWWIGAVTSGGATTWSAAQNFTITAMLAPTVTGPMGTISTTTPRFTWTAANGAASYDIWVDDLTTGVSQVLRKKNLSGTSLTVAANEALQSGHNYVWWVGSVSTNGLVEIWSAGVNFAIS